MSRMRLTQIGSEFESIIAGVIFFLLGGFISFALCFCCTNVFLCYKRRVLIRHRYSIDDLDYAALDDNTSPVSPPPPNKVVVVDAGKLQQPQIYTKNNEQKRPSDDTSVVSSPSTSSTNET